MFELVGPNKSAKQGRPEQIGHDLNYWERWNLVLIKVNFKSTKMDRDFLLAGAQYSCGK